MRSSPRPARAAGAKARALFDEVALSEELDEFLTLPAYELID